MTAALEVADLSYAYVRARKALDGVTFSVPAASFTALLGPNGAGKTTLMALVTRLFEAESGRITVCGLDLKTRTRDALASMGVVFQRLTLDLDLSVEQNLAYAAGLYGLPGRTARSRIDEALQRFSLAERRREKVRTLSGGLKRRVEIARALIHRPRLLVLDEPTVGLDIESRTALVEHAHRLCGEERLAVLWATHLIDEIWPEDRVVILHDGRVRAAGPVGEVVAGRAAGGLADAYRGLTARAA
ncbi:MAG TPA: ABC transporter ATP-binding protein [Geminicoccaceae bacterium]|nr:ABC transporter ATP-binding protein [Geminicoccaceae bacterium]